ncbi:hypothetical protein [uncultured Mediterranean phage uvMED]|nr:hypothetical protein [uncultured Mediterranean phage uvMED]
MKLLVAILLLFGTVATITDVKAENTVSSTVVTNSTPPTANAPSIINSNSDICKVGVGASVQNNIVGLASGIVIDDELCQKLKLSRSLYAYGMKVAAVALLCQDPRVWTSMMDSSTPCPVNGFIGNEAAQYWSENPSMIPDGSRYKTQYTQQREAKEQPIGNNDGLKNFALMALSMLLIL